MNFGATRRAISSQQLVLKVVTKTGTRTPVIETFDQLIRAIVSTLESSLEAGDWENIETTINLVFHIFYDVRIEP